MYREFVREMTEAERHELSRTLQEIGRAPLSLLKTAKWTSVWAIGLTICGAVELWSFSRVQRGNVFVLAVLMGMAGVGGLLSLFAVIALVRGYVHWTKAHRAARLTTYPLIEQAIRLGKVSVKKVESSSVTVIEPVEPDEGCGYVFDIGDGQVFFLKGQEYFPVSDDMDWPNSDFEIVRTVGENLWVGVFCYGGRLDPVNVIPMSQCREDVVRSHREEVLVTTPQDFCCNLTRLA